MMLAPETTQVREREVAVPLVVIAALCVGALGGYAYGLGAAEQKMAREAASQQTAQAAVGSIVVPTPPPQSTLVAEPLVLTP